MTSTSTQNSNNQLLTHSSEQKKCRLTTSGYFYKCGCCQKVSRAYNEESGMKLWKRLHFKKNEECKIYDRKFISEGYNNHLVDIGGKKHNVSSARQGNYTGIDITKLGGGHKKAHMKIAIKDKADVERYLKAAEDGNEDFQSQIRKDEIHHKISDYLKQRQRAMTEEIQADSLERQRRINEFQGRCYNKKSITLECRVCGDLGYYEDIKDDDDDFEFGLCGECDYENAD